MFVWQGVEAVVGAPDAMVPRRLGTQPATNHAVGKLSVCDTFLIVAILMAVVAAISMLYL